MPARGRTHLLALLAVAALRALLLGGGAHALEVDVAAVRLEPGERQTVTVSGLERGEDVDIAWIDPTGRVREARTRTANRKGKARVRFRTAGALRGPHRVVARHTAIDYLTSPPATHFTEVEAHFEVLPGEPPEYLAVLDVGLRTSASSVEPRAQSSREGDAAHPAIPGFAALARSGGGRPFKNDTATAGWLTRVFEGGPPFLELDPARLRALRTAYRKNPSDELLARPVCLHDRSWLEHVWRWAAPRVRRDAEGRPWLWSLGRRVELGPAPSPGGQGLDFCRSPHCMRAFASHLRRRYGSIRKLNRVWRASFAGFDDARPATTFELLTALAEIARCGETDGDLAARLPGMLASWNDHRTFIDATWEKALARCRDRVRSADRRAKVGLEGVRFPGIFTGYDPTRCLRVLDWMETRPRTVDFALARSFGRRRFRTLTDLGGAHPASSGSPPQAGEPQSLPAGRRDHREHRGRMTRQVTGAAKSLPSVASVFSVAGRSPDRAALDLWRGFVNGHRGAILRREGLEGLPAQEVRSLRKALRTLGGGLAALVGRSTWEPDPVAVLYSQASVRVEWLLTTAGLAEGGSQADPGLPPPPSPGRALAAWAELLSDIGFSAEFVSSSDVARKALRRSEARVLILPRAYVLGRAEFREIRRFVRAGGLVIADAGAGLYDEVFTDALSPRVSDLFTIERARCSPLSGRRTGRRREVANAPKPLWRRRDEGLLELAPLDRPGAFIDGVGPEGLRVAEKGLSTLPGFAFAGTAAWFGQRRGPDRAAGEGGPPTAAIVSSPSGRGRAVYLNLALEHYPDCRSRRGGANLRRLVRNVLELAQVEPRVGVVAGGEPVWGCERNSWRLEETEVFTMWLDPALVPEAVLDAELVFDRPAYCYDAREGVLLGSSRRIRVRLEAGANVFARMPYDVESITIRAREKARGIASEIVYEAVVETTTGFAGTHIVSQDLLDPEGRRVPGGSRTIIAERGVAKGRVRMALNEPPGEYSLVLRDATTGVEGTISITRGETEMWKRYQPERR